MARHTDEFSISEVSSAHNWHLSGFPKLCLVYAYLLSLCLRFWHFNNFPVIPTALVYIFRSFVTDVRGARTHSAFQLLDSTWLMAGRPLWCLGPHAGPAYRGLTAGSNLNGLLGQHRVDGTFLTRIHPLLNLTTVVLHKGPQMRSLVSFPGTFLV